MLSRVADCAYWMSRYLDRAEHTARLGDVCLGLTLDRSSDTVRRLMGGVGTPPRGYGVKIEGIENAAPEVRLNKTLEACVAAARENARQVREQISTEMWEQLNRLYAQSETRVDSPIDDALKARRGVCQDLAHIMIALARRIGIPCRYVSGYLSPGTDNHDRSAEGATHAWAEAFLPTLGWVGFDLTNDVLAAERHIRVAVGRDYADVPPTRGVFRGEAGSVLAVLVMVSLADAPIRPERVMPMSTWVAPEVAEPPDAFDQAQQQQQQ